jgi:hypothetical protein
MPFILAFFITLFGANALADIYGSRASFLLMDTAGMSLSYLSDNVDDAWRRRMENALLANGDTHIYIYTQNEADDVGDVSPKPDWEARLDRLNSIGLRPMLWLMADDSPSLAGRPLSAHMAHNAEMVRRFDDKVDAYIIGLESDEYWDANSVTALVNHLKPLTDKPVGVHLTPGIKPAHYAAAEVIFLQTGFNLNEAEFRQRVAEALALGLPVIVAEYDLQSDSNLSRRYGDIACEMGAIGTGNGRSVTKCGQREQAAKKKPWYQEYEEELVIVGIAMASAYVVYRWDIPLTISATENNYQIGLSKDFEESSVGISYRDDGAVMGTIQLRF